MKKRSIIILPIIAVMVVFFHQSVIQKEHPENASVQILEKTSDAEESSYVVGVTLPATDFSDIGKILSNKIADEWKIYDGMTEVQRLSSSKLWGCTGVGVNTWNECEKTIGLDVENPLESLDMLNKTGYFGMESAENDTTVKHILISANSALNSERKLNEINITAGYSIDNIRITLCATLSSKSGMYTSGSTCNGYASYEEMATNTGSGIPVLIVTTDEINNTGYYDSDYFNPTAYWVEDNIFYTLRVFGYETDRDEIQATLERILEGI
ncbi:MAG: hypothetical protein E7384_01300 [Ruminococcaceae bacterium]|nr:hypothetical protein [Oscillospiraceae bacterium]